MKGLRISSKGSKSFFENWRLVEKRRSCCFFNWKAGETRRWGPAKSWNFEVWKIRWDHEIKECKPDFFSVCLFVSIIWTVWDLIFRHFEAFERLVQRGPLGPKPSELARAPWERRDRDAFVPWPWKLGEFFGSFFHWNKELHWQICLVKVMLLMVSNIFYFHPYLGKIPTLTNIFQRGWNHQLGDVSTFLVW